MAIVSRKPGTRHTDV